LSAPRPVTAPSRCLVGLTSRAMLEPLPPTAPYRNAAALTELNKAGAFFAIALRTVAIFLREDFGSYQAVLSARRTIDVWLLEAANDADKLARDNFLALRAFPADSVERAEGRARTYKAYRNAEDARSKRLRSIFKYAYPVEYAADLLRRSKRR